MNAMKNLFAILAFALVLALVAVSTASGATQVVTIDADTGTVLNTPIVIFPSAKISLNGNAITSGIVAESRIDPAITRDAELTSAINALQGKYAVFQIPVPLGSGLSDFEIKASTNDFLADPMLYFYHSPDPTKLVITEQVWTNRPDVYFTDSGKTGTPNRRAWIKQNTTQSIVTMLADANSEVGGIIVIVRDDLSANRDTAVWSYAFVGGEDALGRDIWRPITPAWTDTLDPTIN